MVAFVNFFNKREMMMKLQNFILPICVFIHDFEKILFENKNNLKCTYTKCYFTTHCLNICTRRLLIYF